MDVVVVVIGFSRRSVKREALLLELFSSLGACALVMRELAEGLSGTEVGSGHSGFTVASTADVPVSCAISAALSSRRTSPATVPGCTPFTVAVFVVVAVAEKEEEEGGTVVLCTVAVG